MESGETMTMDTIRREVQPASQPQNDSANQAIVILLVDDDPDVRLLIADAIAECKASNRIFEVGNGEEALAFLNREGQYADAPRPGLIYLDIEMPGIGGQET